MSRPLFLLLLLGCAPAVDAQDIRVRLFEGRTGSEAQFTAVEAPLAVFVDGAAAATVYSGESVGVEADGDRVTISAEGIRQSGRRVEIVTERLARLRAARRDRTYSGTFEIASTGRSLRIVNRVDVEPYVASVVASEYPFKEIEGAKAQAVLARTYALRHRGDFPDYDVEDSQRSQVYKGERVITATTREAARQTRGLVLRHEGGLAEAVYSSSSGGHTASNEDVWNGAPIAYLRGRPDPWDVDAPDHRWTTTASAARVHRALARYGRVTGIEIADRSHSGHLRRVTLLPSGRDITGPQFRVAINASLGARKLKSTNVDITRSGDTYTFTGGGFGHGVGMSQYGARGQARAGFMFEDILAFYFPGTTLDLVEGGAPRPLLARGQSSGRWPTRRSEAHAADSTGAGGAPRVVTPTRRPAWVVREALPNGGRVRTRPTPRREAREAERASGETPRKGWN